MKSILIILFLAFAGSTAYGQITIDPKIKIDKKLKVKKKGKKLEIAPGTNSGTPVPQATESNRKRPGGTINNGSNSKAIEGEKPKIKEKKK